MVKIHVTITKSQMNDYMFEFDKHKEMEIWQNFNKALNMILSKSTSDSIYLTEMHAQTQHNGSCI